MRYDTAKNLQILDREISDARYRPACSDLVYVRGRRVDVPAGYQLAKGPVQRGDRYLNALLFLREGKTIFLSADRFIGQRPVADVPEEHAADGFAMLIRPAQPEAFEDDRYEAAGW